MDHAFDKRDSLRLKGLRLDAHLGVEGSERDVLQAIRIDLQIYMDLRPAAAADQLQFALDYRLIQCAIRDFLRASHFKLIETLALRVSELLLARWPEIQAVRIRVKKPSALPDAKYACIALYRERGAPAGERRE